MVKHTDISTGIYHVLSTYFIALSMVRCVVGFRGKRTKAIGDGHKTIGRITMRVFLFLYSKQMLT